MEPIESIIRKHQGPLRPLRAKDMSESGDAAELGDPQSAPQSEQAAPNKVRKQLPQRSVDEFWNKVRTDHPSCAYIKLNDRP